MLYNCIFTDSGWVDGLMVQGDRVIIYMPAVPEAIIAMLATIRSVNLLESLNIFCACIQNNLLLSGIWKDNIFDNFFYII